jgi:hypothetical protein
VDAVAEHHLRALGRPDGHTAPERDAASLQPQPAARPHAQQREPQAGEACGLGDDDIGAGGGGHGRIFADGDAIRSRPGPPRPKEDPWSSRTPPRRRRRRRRRSAAPRRRRRPAKKAKGSATPPVAGPAAPVPPPPAPPLLSTIQSPIAVYSGAFGPRQAERLLWRAGFGPRPGQARELAALGLEKAVLSLTRPSGTAPMDGPAPTDDGQPLSPYDHWGHDLLFWLDRMVSSRHQLVERLSLVFHDWFATSNDAVGRAG